MDNKTTIKANENNDRKFWTGMEDELNKKKQEEERKFEESGNNEGPLQYFTE